ncbi:BTAD domain-containing putative transcriptional regulator [Jatrophihabitans fulvus]
MRVGVLGPVEAVTAPGRPVYLGSPMQQRLLAVLALHRGSTVATDTIVDALWPASPPDTAAASLQTYVARLRRALEPDRPARMPSEVLVTRPTGYELALPADALDAGRFASAVDAAAAAVAALPGSGVPTDAAAVPGRPAVEQVVRDLRAALRLWRGVPFVELDAHPGAVAERARLSELRLVAQEQLAVARLALGEHATVAGELEALTLEHPLRERLWALRTLALTRAGRQGDALEALAGVRSLLADELGLEPGPELQDLQVRVLRQDATLAWQPLPDTVRPAGGPDPVPAPRPARADPIAPWPMVGRGSELDDLVALLDADGPRVAVVTGEPGIGKTRLAAEFGALARARGVPVTVGRCSQDEGAPPLWPWAQVLTSLGAEPLPAVGTDAPGEPGAQFRSRQAIVTRLLAAARDRPLVVGLDDLHWSDESSLQVLQLLVEQAGSERLVVVATWRDSPPPSGPLGDLAAALARHHALRLHLGGLGEGDVAEIVAAITHDAADAGLARTLRGRTDGNPFFLVEFARLAPDAAGLAALLAAPDPPAGIGEVVSRRVAALPPSCVDVLRAACVLGRRVELPDVAQVSGVTEDDALTALTVAAEGGLIRETGVDEFVFAHALVRDTLYAALPVSRAARLHARAAESLADRPQRIGEVARHWFAAGPRHVTSAWRAGADAARAARAVHAYAESADLLRRSVTAADADTDATVEDCYDLRAELVDALRLTADETARRPVVHEALALAWELDDVERVVEAATSLTRGSLWIAAVFGEVDEIVVGSLRRALDRLTDTDSPTRCLALLALAAEVYHAPDAPQGRDALADEAVAMARRLGDPALLLHALTHRAVATWWLPTAVDRIALTREAAALARDLGAERELVEAQLLLVSALGEAGMSDEIFPLWDEAWAGARRQHHLFAQVILAGFVVPWLAMRDELGRATELRDTLAALIAPTNVQQGTEALAGTALVLAWWAGEAISEVVATLRVLRAVSPLPLVGSLAGFLCGAGREDEARALLLESPPKLDDTTWMAPLEWGMTAQAAAFTAMPDLAAAAYAKLAPHAGRALSAGSGPCLGPVDAFLAYAAYGVGDHALAASHADDAEKICEQWQAPLAARWWRGQRDRFGF